MGVKERLLDFITSKNLTVAEFERICGLSNGYVSKIKNTVGFRILSDITRVFPELDKDWLMNGEGEMLKSSVIQQNQNGDNIHGESVTVHKSETDKLLETIAACHEIIKKKDEQIDKLLSMLGK